MQNYLTVSQRLGFVYCPKCSSGNIVNRGNKSVSCKDCDYIFYQNNAAAVAVIIEYQDKIILVRRARNPLRGMLDLPGGFVDPFESLEDAAIREVREELGLEIAKLQYLSSAPNTYLYRGVTYLTTDAFFSCQVDSLEDIRPADDVSEHILISPRDINLDEIAFDSVKTTLARIYISHNSL